MKLEAGGWPFFHQKYFLLIVSYCFGTRSTSPFFYIHIYHETTSNSDPVSRVTGQHLAIWARKIIRILMFGIGQLNAVTTRSIYPFLVDLGCGSSILRIPISTFFQKAWTKSNLGKMDPVASQDPQDIAEKGIMLLVDINRTRRRICWLLNRDMVFQLSLLLGSALLNLGSALLNPISDLHLNSSLRIACSLAQQILVDDRSESV